MTGREHTQILAVASAVARHTVLRPLSRGTKYRRGSRESGAPRTRQALAWKTLRYIDIVALLAIVAPLALVDPVAAQEACASQFGQMTAALENGAANLLASFLIIAIVAAVVIKAVPIPGTNRWGNAAVGGVFAAIIVLVALFSVAEFAAAYSPIDLSSSCGGVTGGGGGGAGGAGGGGGGGG